MSLVMKFEVRSERRVIVTVDVAKHVATYPQERAEFDGSDEEFVKHSLAVIGTQELLSSGGEEIDDGLTIADDYDEDEIDLIASFSGFSEADH